jgi:hypothetical protein
VLNLVRQALVDAGAIAPGANLQLNARLTGDTIAIEVHDGAGGWFHVKASQVNDFAGEFEAYRRARQRYAEMVPEPVTCARIDGWSILAARSVDHDKVRVRDVMDASRLGAELLRFFEISRDAPEDGAGRSDEALMLAVREHFGRSGQESDRVLRHLERACPPRGGPFVPQHGDFVLNNIGRAGRRLVVFDWEELGATGLAGFDVCMMALSIAGNDTTTVDRMLDARSPHEQPWPLTGGACAACGIPYDDFRASIPTYLIVFRYFKRNYGSAIRGRIDALLDHVLG